MTLSIFFYSIFYRYAPIRKSMRHLQTIILPLLAMAVTCKPPVNRLDSEQMILLGHKHQSTIAPVVPVLRPPNSDENGSPRDPTENSPTVRLFNIKPGDEVRLYSDSTCLDPISERKSAIGHHLDISTLPLGTGNHQIYAKSWDSDGNASSCSPHHIDFSYYVSAPTMTTEQSTNEEDTPTIVLSNLYSGGSVQIFSDSACTEPISNKENVPETANTLNITPSQSESEDNDQIYARSWDSGGNPSSCSTHSMSSSLPEPLPILIGQSSSFTDNTPTIYLAHLPSNGEYQLFSDSACTQSVSSRNSVNSPTMRVSTNPLPIGTHNIHVQTWDEEGNPSPCSSTAATFTYKIIPPRTVLKRGESSPTNPTPTISLYNLYAGGTVQLFSDATCSNPLIPRQNVAESNTMDITINPLTPGTHRIYSQSWDAQGNSSNCSPHFTGFTYRPPVSQQSQPISRTPGSTKGGPTTQKTFGTIQAPVYKKTSRGGGSLYGGKRIIEMQSKPGISVGNLFIDGTKLGYKYVSGAGVVDFATLPNGDKLIWKYSIRHKRGNSMTDGICSLASNYGGIHVEEKKIQTGDACVVTATASAPGYKSKSVYTSVYWYGTSDIRNIQAPTASPSEPTIKTFGTIQAPVYKKTSRGGGSLYGGKRIIEMQSKPGISVGNLFIDGTKLGYKYVSGAGVVDFATLPNGDKLIWKYSIRHKRGNSMTDGICSLASNYGGIHVEEKNIQTGDACVVTATASAPGYKSKSVSTSVYWYGPNDIRNASGNTQAPSSAPSRSPALIPNPTPSTGQTPTKKFNILAIRPPVFESKPNAIAVGGKLTVDMKSPPTYNGRSSHLSTGEKLTWTYSVQGFRGGSSNNDICLMSSAGVLQVTEKKIRKGDNCKITYTVAAPGYHSTSMTMNHFWQYIPVSQCKGGYAVRKTCNFNERIPYNWGNSFTHKCIKRDLVNIGTNTTGSLRCTGCVVSREYPCN